LARKPRSKVRKSLTQHPTLRYEKKALRKGHKSIAGVDESGVGPLAGPVVAAAVILKEYKFENRIDDSKRLTPKKRLRAYKEILKNSVYSIAVVNHRVVDRINIYNATKLAMEKAIRKLRIKPDYLLIDGTIKLSIPYRGHSIKQGDRCSLSIACASIIAKVTRDRIMRSIHRIYPQYGFARHKGYGTSVHFRALKMYGPSPAHRLSFEPVRSMNTGREKQ
jgi:ribonuclease HII